MSDVKEENLKSWEDFLDRIKSLQKSFRSKPNVSLIGNRPYKALFRGHSSRAWKLETTLDRLQKNKTEVRRYFQKSLQVRAQLESFFEKNIPALSYEDYCAWFKSEDNLQHRLYFGELPGHQLKIYLRHHHYPSPLLDWTLSPYIACFFAFNYTEQLDDYVSIFVLSERNSKKYHLSKPVIDILHPTNSPYHPRHIAQQATYTFCLLKEKNNIYYTSHEHAISENNLGYDIVKLNIPASERNKVLEYLDDYNINQHTLFGSEESLIQSIAARQFKTQT